MNRITILLNILAFTALCPFAMTLEDVTDMYFEDGIEYAYRGEDIENEFIDGIFYEYYNGIDGYDKKEVGVYSKFAYREDGRWNLGGFYTGDLEIPAEVYGYDGRDCWFTVKEIMDMYKNGLTSLYLPETIESLGGTIVSCRFLKKIQLNNSLKELNGIKDCPELSDCTLPLSLERIGDGWMSGIAITETDFPQTLATIGKNVFCNNHRLNRINLCNLETMGDSCFRQLPSLQEIVIPETLQSMGAYSFSSCEMLEKVTLSKNTVLTEGCFNECPSITEVVVYAETPNPFPSNCMKDTDKSKCTLYVPTGSEELYAESDGWKEFGMIVPCLNTGLGSVSATSEWRAFASRGKLFVDTDCEVTVRICNLSGKTMETVNSKGRNELTLPKGVYIVSSQGKSMKIIL